NVDATEHVYPMQVRGGAMNEMILTKPEKANA
ncbi:acetolactate synthase 3 catalytic subunit, partial [Pasteurella multocida subsp. multocida str. Anand1_cattle]